MKPSQFAREFMWDVVQGTFYFAVVLAAAFFLGQGIHLAGEYGMDHNMVDIAIGVARALPPVALRAVCTPPAQTALNV